MTHLTYTAQYRVPTLFRRWQKLTNVIGDGIIADAGIRFFTLIYGEMIYIPLNSEVVFSKEREIAIHTKIKQEAGQ